MLLETEDEQDDEYGGNDEYDRMVKAQADDADEGEGYPNIRFILGYDPLAEAYKQNRKEHGPGILFQFLRKMHGVIRKRQHHQRN